MPSSELLAPVGRVLFPALVEARDRRQTMRQIYLIALALQAMFAIPAATGLALVANDALAVLLGQRWMSAVRVVQVLALIYGATAISHAADSWKNQEFSNSRLGANRVCLPAVRSCFFQLHRRWNWQPCAW
jgi:O-antigen/teichoic acid export membrane protein